MLTSGAAVRETPAADAATPAAVSVPPSEAQAAVYQAASRLFDSLLHDARNPLNAVAINVEVLAEKLKDDGAVPESLDKNLRAIREQVYRVDAILRQFPDFVAPRLGTPLDSTLADLVERALEVTGHEARRRRVKLRPLIETAGTLITRDGGALALLLAQLLLRAIGRADAGSELVIQVSRQGDRAVVRVQEPRRELPAEPADAQAPLHALARVCGGQVELSAGQAVLSFAHKP